MQLFLLFNLFLLKSFEVGLLIYLFKVGNEFPTMVRSLLGQPNSPNVRASDPTWTLSPLECFSWNLKLCAELPPFQLFLSLPLSLSLSLCLLVRPDTGAESAKALFYPEDKPHPRMPRSPNPSPRPDNGTMRNPDLIYVWTAQIRKYCTVYAPIHAYRYTATVPLSCPTFPSAPSPSRLN